MKKQITPGEFSHADTARSSERTAAHDIGSATVELSLEFTLTV